MDVITLESCHSTWVFEPNAMRFRRILKEIEVGDHAVATGWRPYFRLQLESDSEAFTVFLNPEGSRLIRSWRHTQDCQQCGGHVTAVLSLTELRNALSA
ncbi:MAG TPA: hypothetical protein VHV57_06735 [Acidimicrobiales bacterium]|jgi:hypothetical protein|nr:hypothetical protein [Acidimicrobiales bacterium]